MRELPLPSTRCRCTKYSTLWYSERLREIVVSSGASYSVYPVDSRMPPLPSSFQRKLVPL